MHFASDKFKHPSGLEPYPQEITFATFWNLIRGIFKKA